MTSQVALAKTDRFPDGRHSTIPNPQLQKRPASGRRWRSSQTCAFDFRRRKAQRAKLVSVDLNHKAPSSTVRLTLGSAKDSRVRQLNASVFSCGLCRSTAWPKVLGKDKKRLAARDYEKTQSNSPKKHVQATQSELSDLEHVQWQ